MVLPPAVTMKSRARSIKPQGTVAPFADIAGTQPAIGAFDLARRLIIVPIALEQIGAADQHFAILGQPDLDAFDRRADIAGAREGAALAGDDAAGFLGLAVHLDDVDAVHMPERHGLGRQRGAAADHQLQLVEAELVEDRPENQRHAGCA